MKSVVVIPARYASTRFPGKPLVKLLGKPMILWVAELCAKAVGQASVYVATEDERIANTVREAGFRAVMTSTTALTGTDRIAEAARQIDAEIFINVQGDEPLLNPNDILEIIGKKEAYPDEIINGYCPLAAEEDPYNINIPKVVFTGDHRLLYISRLPVPGYKNTGKKPEAYYKQVCIYAFTRDELQQYHHYGRKSRLEDSEDIEILRFFEWGATVRMVETSPGSLAIDVKEDIPMVEKHLRAMQRKA
ncbi:MAG: 3-deoxy-manno-octulosonate cytidylyltransferase [Methanoregulaceae archaeon]|jgi:3-deoxy-manno-octulosonate cytidylyltransferase (CMP-KDO synthetase)